MRPVELDRMIRPIDSPRSLEAARKLTRGKNSSLNLNGAYAILESVWEVLPERKRAEIGAGRQKALGTIYNLRTIVR